MQALQDLLPGILQGPGYPAWMCVLCPRLQLSERFSHEVKPLPLSSIAAEYQLSQHSVSLSFKHLVRQLFGCFTLCHHIRFEYVLKLPP